MQVKYSIDSYTTLSSILKQQQNKMLTQLIQNRKRLRYNALRHLIQNKLGLAFHDAQEALSISRKLKQFFTKLRLSHQLQFYLCESINFQFEVEHMFDTLIIVRVLQKNKHYEKIRGLISKLCFDFSKFNLTQESQVFQLNNQRAFIIKYQSILKALILVISKIQLLDCLQTVFDHHSKFVRKYFGAMELASVYFEHGTTLTHMYELNSNKSKLVQKAIFYFQLCRDLREKFSQSIGLADALTNLASLYAPSNKQRALDYYQKSLRIKRELQPESPLTYCQQLEALGKLYLEKLNMVKSFRYLKKCHSIRKKYLGSSVVLKRSEILLVYLYINATEHDSQIAKRIRNQIFCQIEFQNYRVVWLSIVRELQLNINLNFKFFSALNSEQVQDLCNLISALRGKTMVDGLQLIFGSNFCQKLSSEMKQIFLNALNSEQLSTRKQIELQQNNRAVYVLDQ